MNYFVTGATGFIGRFLVARLLKREGARVFALVRPGSEYKLDAMRRRLCVAPCPRYMACTICATDTAAVGPYQ